MMKTGILKVVVFFILGFLPVGVSANDITISKVRRVNTSIISANHPGNHTFIQFNIQWENSWRHGTVFSGGLVGVFIRTGGSGYTDGIHQISFTGGGSATPATAQVVVAGGSIISVNSFTPGSGYTSPPTGFSGSTIGNGVDGVFDAHIRPWWDAAWVFIKYRVNGGEWKHAKLSTNATDHIAGTGTGTSFSPGSDGTGVFVYRDAPGIGTFSNSGIALKWMMGLDGVGINDRIDVRVFAVEMVYVPQCAFELGGAGQSGNEFRRANDISLVGYTQSFTIDGSPIVFSGNHAGANPVHLSTRCKGADYSNTTLGGPQTDLDSSTKTVPVPAAFPLGFKAFYCMKYELSQGQYRDFLNTLTREQQANRFLSTRVGDYMGITTESPSPGVRNGIRLVVDPGGTGARTYACDLNPSAPPYTKINEDNDGEWIACNYIDWMDLSAYLDWAALRPMTEMEFEKVGRGDQPPVPHAYAWSTKTVGYPTNLLNVGRKDEYTSTVGANAVSFYGYYPNMIEGPMRVGIFATANSNRVSAGATYYGATEMSGNLWECVITVGNAAGRSYTGMHGNGILSSNGSADVFSWPGGSAAGTGLRGGTYTSASSMYLSGRLYGTWQNGVRDRRMGGRGVRYAE